MKKSPLTKDNIAKNRFKIRGKVWLYPGNQGNWHFLSVPKKESKEITTRFGLLKRGWGSLPVIITIGKTNWRSSIFPDKKSQTYLLPLKAEVRKAEKITVGNAVNFIIKIRV